MLIDLGLIHRDTQDGEEVLKIQSLLPLPEDCLRISPAERGLPGDNPESNAHSARGTAEAG